MRRHTMISTACALLAAGAARAADPWADQVVDASAELDASGLYNDPQSILGMPATTYWDPWSAGQFAVSLVASAFNLDAPAGNKLITTIPAGQFVKVRFDEPVEDHPRNPYGIDLLVFGNAFFRGSSPGGPLGPATDMETYSLTDGSVADEPVTVAVSSSGIGTPATYPGEWYVYDTGPYADSWFPTQAYAWDRLTGDWGDALDFTVPVDPALGMADFDSISAADAIDLYERSGGGTGIDLAPSGYAAIRCVYLASTYAGEPGEIDALSDVFPALGDFDRDGDLDLADFARLQACFTGAGGGPRSRDCFPADFDADKDVDLDDYTGIEQYLAGPG